MVSGLWGKKIGMTQVFSQENTVVPVTVVDVAGWYVTNIKTLERDGYAAVQVGLVKKRYMDDALQLSWLKKPKQYFSFLREVRVKAENIASLPAVGQRADFLSVLSEGLLVDVLGKSKGCGFAGVVKRHDFAGARGSHGSTMGKHTGSIGSYATQGRVIKGKKMPGHMGYESVAIKNLKVVKVDKDAQAVLVKGAIPGKSGRLVFIRKEII